MFSKTLITNDHKNNYKKYLVSQKLIRTFAYSNTYIFL
jgi:hypothetical protein